MATLEKKLLDPLSYGLSDLNDVEVKGGVGDRKDGNYALKWSGKDDIFSVVPLPAPSKGGGVTKLIDLEDCEQIENLVNATNERPFALKWDSGASQFQPLEFIPIPISETNALNGDCDELDHVGERYKIGPKTKNAPDLFEMKALLIAINPAYQIVYHPFTQYFRQKSSSSGWSPWHNVRTSDVLSTLCIDLRPIPSSVIMQGRDATIKRIQNDHGSWFIGYQASQKTKLVYDETPKRTGISGGQLRLVPQLQKFGDLRATVGTVVLDCVLKKGTHTPLEHITLEAANTAHVQIVISITPTADSKVRVAPEVFGVGTSKIVVKPVTTVQDFFTLKTLSLEGVTLFALRYTKKIANLYEVSLLCK